MRAISLFSALMLLGACGSNSASSETIPAAVVVQTASAPVLEVASVATQQAGTRASATPPPPTMPNVVCMNLQEAQDTIQRAGVFFSRSFDGTGKGRMQIFDRNWIVVSQEPASGTPIGEGDANLGAVKYGEPNSC